MAQLQEFTLAAIYADNNQRFGDSMKAENVTDALIAMVKRMRIDNGDSEDELVVCGLFAGNHNVADLSVMYSDERPVRLAQPGAEKFPFTVVTDEALRHVMAADEADAELDIEQTEDLRVAAVFAGHLVDISAQVDWEKYEAETAIPAEEAA